MAFITYLKWLTYPSKKIYLTDTLRIRADMFPDGEWGAYIQEKETKSVFSRWVFPKDDKWWFSWFYENETKEEILRVYRLTHPVI